MIIICLNYLTTFIILMSLYYIKTSTYSLCIGNTFSSFFCYKLIGLLEAYTCLQNIYSKCHLLFTYIPNTNAQAKTFI